MYSIHLLNDINRRSKFYKLKPIYFMIKFNLVFKWSDLIIKTEDKKNVFQNLKMLFAENS